LLSKQTDYSSTIVVVELLMGLEGTKSPTYSHSSGGGGDA